MIGVSHISVAAFRGGGGAAPNTDFISTWDTTKAGSASDTVVLPLQSGGTYSGTIDWGDGSTSVLSYANRTHTYSAGGTYTITISGSDIIGFGFYAAGDRRKIIDISNWGNLTITYGDSCFESCTNLDISATDAPTFTTNTFKDFFKSCPSLTTCDFSNWDTSGIVSMETMFEACTNFNGDITTWDTSNVTTFSRSNGAVGMFSNCVNFNQDISGWNVSNCTNFRTMFSSCSVFNQDLSSWDISNGAINGMFAYCTAFNNGGAAGIGNWDTSSKTSFGGLFRNTQSFTQDISGWNTSNVTNMFRFSVGSNFNVDIGSWDVSSVTNMESCFESNTAFDQDISGWDISNVTNFNKFYAFASGFSTVNYDAILIGWGATLQAAYPGGVGYTPTISISFGGSQYTLGGAAEAARTLLITNFGWTISDGGGV